MRFQVAGSPIGIGSAVRTRLGLRLHHWLNVVALAALLVGPGGCGLSATQRGAIAKFAEASTELGDLASQEYAAARADNVALRTGMAELHADTVFTDPKDPNSKNHGLEGAITVAAVENRVAGLEALKHYGQLLEALAASDQEGAIATAGTSLVTSLKKFDGVKISDEKTGAIGTVITTVANQAVEFYKAETIKKVVVTTRGPVNEVVSTVENDFDLGHAANPQIPLFSYDLLVSTIDEEINDTLKKKMSSLAPTTATATSAAVTDADVAVARGKFAALQAKAAQIRQEHVLVLGRILDSMTKFQAAHQAMIDAANSIEFSDEDINAYFKSVQDVESAVKILRK